MTGGNVHYKTPTTSKSGQFTMRSDAATPVKTVDSGQKTALLHSQKKKTLFKLTCSAVYWHTGHDIQTELCSMESVENQVHFR